MGLKDRVLCVSPVLVLLSLAYGALKRGVLFHGNNQKHADVIIIMSAYSHFLDKLPPKCFTHCGPVFLSQSISEAAAQDYLQG